MKKFINTIAIEEFVNSISSLIDSKRILLNKQQFTRYLFNTESLDRNISLVIQVISNIEIKNIVILANKHRIPIYPISIGANWGYGSSLPVTDNNVVVDLSLMNKIIEINEEHGYAIIEPGVTQEQLSEYLKINKSKFHFDPTGAGPNTSIIGNILERGFGLGIYGDHYKSLNNFEVLLPNGELFKTGFWNNSKKDIVHCFTNAIGPDTKGIFTQANFGIITKACFNLTPIPDKIKLAIINCSNTNELTTNLVELKKLFLQEALVSGCNITCSTRILTTIMQYPWKAAKNITPLPGKLKTKLVKKYKLSEWSILIPLRGTTNQVIAQEKDLKKIVKNKSSLKIYDEIKINFYDKMLTKLFITLPFLKTIKKMKAFFEFLKGEPMDMTLASPYWRNKNAPPIQNRNPALDNCGLIWMAPTIPFAESDVKEFLNITIPVLHKYGIDDAISLLFANKKSLIATIPLLYDKDSSKETKNAHECYEVLNRIYEAKGFLVYRKAIHSMPRYDSGAYQDFIKSLKKHIDPNNIIAPGRYT